MTAPSLPQDAILPLATPRRRAIFERAGQALAGAVTLPDAIAKAGLDYTVEKLPLFYSETRAALQGDTYEVKHEVPGAFATVASDGRIFGTVGDRYQVVQNADAFGPLAPLFDAGLVRPVNGGEIGGNPFLQVEYDRTKSAIIDEAASRGGALPLATITNNFDGTRRITIGETFIVIVCQNTLAMARRDSVGQIGHTINAEARLTEQARIVWKGIIDRVSTLSEQFAKLQATALDEALFRRLVLDAAAPVPKHTGDKNKARVEVGIAKAETKRTHLTRLWQGEAAGVSGNGSAWDALMAVTESFQHHTDVWGAKTDAPAAIFSGKLGEVESSIFTNLLQAAGAR
jgi:hypothetical protein